MHDLLDIQLRFVEREGSTPRPDLGPNVADNRTVRILQTRRLQPAPPGPRRVDRMAGRAAGGRGGGRGMTGYGAMDRFVPVAERQGHPYDVGFTAHVLGTDDSPPAGYSFAGQQEWLRGWYDAAAELDGT